VVVEQAVWMLGNISGNSSEYRDMVISHGIVDSLLGLLVRVGLPITLLRTIVWVFLNLVRESPVALDVAQKLVPTLAQHLTFRDISMQIYALWALRYIADCGDDYIQIIIDSNIIPLDIPFISNRRNLIQMAKKLISNTYAVYHMTADELAILYNEIPGLRRQSITE